MTLTAKTASRSWRATPAATVFLPVRHTLLFDTYTHTHMHSRLMSYRPAWQFLSWLWSVWIQHHPALLTDGHQRMSGLIWSNQTAARSLFTLSTSLSLLSLSTQLAPSAYPHLTMLNLTATTTRVANNQGFIVLTHIHPVGIYTWVFGTWEWWINPECRGRAEYLHCS